MLNNLFLAVVGRQHWCIYICIYLINDFQLFLLSCCCFCLLQHRGSNEVFLTMDALGGVFGHVTSFLVAFCFYVVVVWWDKNRLTVRSSAFYLRRILGLLTRKFRKGKGYLLVLVLAQIISLPRNSVSRSYT